MTLTVPAGHITSFRPGRTTRYGIPWSDVSRWEPHFSDAAGAYGLDPRLLAAMAVVESHANHYTTGKTAGTRDQVVLGSDRFGDGPAVGIMQVKVQLWDHLIAGDDPYLPRDNISLGAALMRAFVAETGSWQNAIRQKYHPATSGAGVTPQMYVDTVQSLMDEMGGGAVPEWTPTIYDLRVNADAGRFGLSPAQRDAILAKRIPGRNGKAIQAIGLHVQWGWTKGSLDHWLTVSASSTVMVQQDGSVLRVIPEEHGPWTQGEVRNPDARARKLFDRFGWDSNVYSLTIEAEDGQTERINAAQEKSIAWLIRDWQARYPQLAGADWEDRILGHYEIDAVNRARCGRYRDAMVASLRGGTVPAPDPTPQYAERVDIPQPDDAAAFPGAWAVEVVAESLPIRKYAAPDAPEVGPPLAKGRTFSAVYVAFGADAKPWWVSTSKGRVSVEGTRCPALGIGIECGMSEGMKATLRMLSADAADLSRAIEQLAEGE
jgi:hypothetical protein